MISSRVLEGEPGLELEQEGVCQAFVLLLR